jgi:excisionase family DNA binding protein
MREPAIAKDKFCYSIPEAADALGVGGRLVWWWIKNEELKTMRLGRRRVIHRDVLEKFSKRDHAGMPKKAVRS